MALNVVFGVGVLGGVVATAMLGIHVGPVREYIRVTTLSNGTTISRSRSVMDCSVCLNKHVSVHNPTEHVENRENLGEQLLSVNPQTALFQKKKSFRIWTKHYLGDTFEREAMIAHARLMSTDPALNRGGHPPQDFDAYSQWDLIHWD